MSDYDDVERFMRLKRHEKPPEDFVEDFLHAFHQRQRVELMNQSARGLVWERLKALYEDLMTPKYAIASLAGCCALGFTVYSLMPSSPSGSMVVKHEAQKPALGEVSYAEYREARAEMQQNPLYLGSHYRGGFGDAHEAHAATRNPQDPHLRSNPQAQGTALPASYTPKGYGFKLDLD